MALPLSRAVALMAEAPPLGVTWDGDNLHVQAPRLRFLQGKPLERLKNGATVVYLTQISLSTVPGWQNPYRQIPDRLVFSYDLWEEKFSVKRLGPGGHFKDRLTAEEAERWCVENLIVSSSGLAPDRRFWLKLELRVAGRKELSAVVGEPGISITKLVEIFSRKPDAGNPAWSVEAGPLRLSDLTRIQPRRGPRTG